ncbi:hypothetical protein NQ317_019013 [Molorchus minor]|uniref:RNA helicase n=1 Tax=Molorchus minor TaxID=1323400 RepID=A0ABQ9J629_9CUCU|nr:hypothetical protein NQ317_019013 [Molorchus minor]
MKGNGEGSNSVSLNSKIKCQTVVFCDEECEEQMFKFFTFIDQTDLKYRLSDKFKQFSEGIRKDQEQKKLRHQVALCENLKLFGTCSFPSCPLRHILDGNTGVSNHLPRSGKIKFKIVYIQDVTTYSIELLQHVDTDNKVHEFDHLTDVTQELTDLMSFSKKSIVNPVVGHVYAYYDDSENVYYRCDLLEIDNECVRIKLIDRGTILNIVSVTRLYRLPKEFKDNVKPRKIYDAVLANILPPHKDECFSARSFFHLKTLLEKHDYKNIILTGEVHLQLENTLWLLNVYQEVVLSDRVIPSLQLSRTILQMKLAICNNDHLRRLYTLCDSADIEVPKYERSSVETVNEKVEIEPQWAHLDMEVNEVVLSAAISPDEIYFRLNKYSDLKKFKGPLKKPKYPKLNDVEIGTICLAKDPEGEYSRVIVQNIDADKALCFFVDFGDEIAVEISELKHIHKEFITKLPFQAIQCRLHGVKPILNDWQNDVVDILYDYAMEPYTDIFRTLYIKPCLKEENSLLPRQKRYSVVLKDGFGEKKVLVNNLLIECGLAGSDPEEEITNFDIPESAAEVTDSDDCEEVVNDICRKTEKIEEIFSSTVIGRIIEILSDYLQHLTKISDSPIEKGQSYEPDNAKENNDLNEDDLELFLIQPMEFFNQVIFSGENRNGQSNNLELPKIEAAAPVNYCTPDVLWSQTEKTVKLDIKITDVKEYNLTLTKKQDYELQIMLYEKVDTMQHTSMGPQIRIVLTKAKDIEWPRLILSKQRTRNIHYDVSTIFVKDENKKILEISDKESDSDDDDNIDMMYEVFSDIDSDVDVEIERDSD